MVITPWDAPLGGWFGVVTTNLRGGRSALCAQGFNFRAPPGVQISAAVSSPGHRIFDQNELRVEGCDKVTGQYQYTADIKIPGMLVGGVHNKPDRTRAHREHRHQRKNLQSLSAYVLAMPEVFIGDAQRKYEDNGSPLINGGRPPTR
jgi:hypothetical protein